VDNVASLADQAHGSEVPHVLVDRTPVLCFIAVVTLKAVLVILLVSYCPSAVPFDQLGEVAGLLGPSDKRVLEKLLRRRPLLGVALQTKFYKLLEGPRKVPF
jgi:hypothetical protein